MVNYTDVMARGLAARKAVTGGGVRIGRSFKKHSGAQSREESLSGAGSLSGGGGLDGRGATAIQARSGLPRKQAEAGIAKTEAETARLKGAMTPLEKAEVENKRLSNIALGLKNATSFLPRVTKDTYDDFYSWIRESDFVPKGER